MLVASNTHTIPQGLLSALPVMVTYVGIGTACGVIGSIHGLSVAEIALLSLLLYAGSAQFAFPLLYLGSLPALVLTVFLINIRHLIYSLSLSLHTQRMGIWGRCAIGAQLTDESFLIASAKLRSLQIGATRWMLSLNSHSHAAWITGNLLGATFAEDVDFTQFGISFAAAAMFFGLLMQQISLTRRGLQALAVAVASSVCALLAYASGYEYLSIIVIVPIISLIGVLAGCKLPEDEQLASSLNQAKGHNK